MWHIFVNILSKLIRVGSTIRHCRWVFPRKLSVIKIYPSTSGWVTNLLIVTLKSHFQQTEHTLLLADIAWAHWSEEERSVVVFWHVRSFKYSIRFPCGHEIRCQVGMEHSSMMQTSSCCYHSTKNIAIVSLLLLLVHTKGFIRTFSFTWISLFNRQWWKQFV